MFGTNPIRENETQLAGQTLAVQEIFYTLQGEGPFAGAPAVFVRLAGCNLACWFCDTEFESNINQRLSIDTIVKVVTSWKYSGLVVLTGGEPLRQNVVPLMLALFEAGIKNVQIETAGTLWVPGLENLLTFPGHEKGGVLVCSPKTPRINPQVIKNCLHYKYVVEAMKTCPVDGLPVSSTQQKNAAKPSRLWRPYDDKTLAYMQGLGGEQPTIWVSPCDAHETAATQANTAEAVRVALKHGYRLSLQMHKLVGLP